MDFFTKLSQQLRQIWQSMARIQKIVVAISAGLALALVVGIGYWSALTDYQVLYTGLPPEDAGAVTAKLTAQGVSYRLAAGGTTVLVPAEQVQQMRVELAAEGLPAKGGKGFEIFDQTSLGMTPFTQHVNYMRALQSELAKTIMQIDPIVFARVHIVRPEPSPFLRDQKPTTASVMLKLRPGAALNRNVSAGIIAVVARSVEGLARENVTLVDANGRMLSEDQGPEGAALGSQMEQRRELEMYLASKAEAMLAHVLGPGRAIVRVTADVNMKHHKERKETYSPEGRVASSEKILTTRATATGTSKAGAAGAASNVGGAAAPGGQVGSNNVEESVQTDFLVSKVTQEIDDRLGGVERLTIAALVDLSKAGEGAESAMTLADAQDIIKKAVGFKSERDEIKVSLVKLPEAKDAGVDEEQLRQQQWQQVLSLVRNGSLGIVALTALVLGVLFLWGRRKTPATAAPAAEPADVIKMNRLAEVLQGNPQLLARVLENWLDEPKPPRAAAG